MYWKNVLFEFICHNKISANINEKLDKYNPRFSFSLSDFFINVTKTKLNKGQIKSNFMIQGLKSTRTLIEINSKILKFIDE